MQIVPHVTRAIEEWVERVAKIPVDESGEEPDVCIIELGYVFLDWVIFLPDRAVVRDKCLRDRHQTGSCPRY